jgi:hypothetical protein
MSMMPPPSAQKNRSYIFTRRYPYNYKVEKAIMMSPRRLVASEGVTFDSKVRYDFRQSPLSL